MVLHERDGVAASVAASLAAIRAALLDCELLLGPAHGHAHGDAAARDRRPRCGAASASAARGVSTSCAHGGGQLGREQRLERGERRARHRRPTTRTSIVSPQCTPSDIIATVLRALPLRPRAMNRDLGAERAQRRGDQRRGAHVQSMVERNAEAARRPRCARRRGAMRPAARRSTSIRKSPAAISAGPRRAPHDAARRGEHDRRHEARRAARERVEVEAQQRLALRARARPARRAARSLRPSRLTVSMPTCMRTSMPDRGAHRHRMPRALHGHDLAVARRVQRRLPCGSIATPSPAMRAGEHRVGHLGERQAPAREGRDELQRGSWRRSSSRSSRSPTSGSSVALREAQAQVVRCRAPASGAAGSTVTASDCAAGASGMRAIDACHSQLSRSHLQLAFGRRWASGKWIFFTVLADLEVERDLPDGARLSARTRSRSTPRAIQHGILDVDEERRARALHRRIVLERERDVVAAELELLALDALVA